MDDDWRLTPANERLFRDAVFLRKAYSRPQPHWDHDHCSFCFAEFVEEGAPEHEANTFHDGYSTPGPPRKPREDYYWVCPPCFEDFREHLGWTVRPGADSDAT